MFYLQEGGPSARFPHRNNDFSKQLNLEHRIEHVYGEWRINRNSSFGLDYRLQYQHPCFYQGNQTFLRCEPT